MDAKTRRKHLREHDAASRNLELTAVVINILQRVDGAQSVIDTLEKSQQKHLEKLDKAAEKLGAPYGA